MKQSKLLVSTLSALGFLFNVPGLSNAADSPTTPIENAKLDDYQAGRKAIDAKQWGKAIEYFKAVVAKDPNNADAHSLLGFSYRWLNQYPQAFQAYDKALSLKPDHLGALNYSGIAYMRNGQKDEANLRLQKLQQICALCDETIQLEKVLREAK